MNKNLLIDMTNLFYRGYHVSKDLKDRDGNPVSGIYNSLTMLSKLVDHFKANNVVVAWDKGKCVRRLKMNPEYKAGRRSSMSKEEVKNLHWQIDETKKFIKCLPVRQITIESIEADDVIGYLSGIVKGRNIIVSNDHDFIQLIKENVLMFIPKDGTMLHKGNIEDFLGFPVAKFLLYKAMVGDNSDNLKGVSGMGKVRTTKFIQERKKIKEEWKEIILANKKLMKVGYILTKKDKKEIVKQYKNNKAKNVEGITIKKKLRAFKFNSIINKYPHWLGGFNSIRR